MDTKHFIPLPDIVRISEVAKRWGCEVAYLIQFVNEIDFWYGTEVGYLESYRRDELRENIEKFAAKDYEYPSDEFYSYVRNTLLEYESKWLWVPRKTLLAFEKEHNFHPVNTEHIDNVAEIPKPKSGIETHQNTREISPWLIKNINDPEPQQSWYIPARYFARELVRGDPTLLTKSNVLAGKVADSLAKVGIKKRGGKKQFDPGTIKKAFSNVDFSSL